MVNRFMKRLFNIIDQQGNGNQKHSEIGPHICQDGCYYVKFKNKIKLEKKK